MFEIDYFNAVINLKKEECCFIKPVFVERRWAGMLEITVASPPPHGDTPVLQFSSCFQLRYVTLNTKRYEYSECVTVTLKIKPRKCSIF